MQAAPLFAAQAARDAAPLAVTTPTSTNRRPPSVDDTNAQGASSLHLLAAQGSSEGLAVLLAHGADPNLRGARGRTPFPYVADGTNDDDDLDGAYATCASQLLDAGATVDARDAAGRTPLAVAVQAGRLSLVRVLLARGASLVADDAGNSPLHLAVAAPDCLEALLRADGDRSGRPRDANTKTAVAIYERVRRGGAPRGRRPTPPPPRPMSPASPPTPTKIAIPRGGLARGQGRRRHGLHAVAVAPRAAGAAGRLGRAAPRAPAAAAGRLGRVLDRGRRQVPLEREHAGVEVGRRAGRRAALRRDGAPRRDGGQKLARGGRAAVGACGHRRERDAPARRGPRGRGAAGPRRQGRGADPLRLRRGPRRARQPGQHAAPRGRGRGAAAAVAALLDAGADAPRATRTRTRRSTAPCGTGATPARPSSCATARRWARATGAAGRRARTPRPGGGATSRARRRRAHPWPRSAADAAALAAICGLLEGPRRGVFLLIWHVHAPDRRPVSTPSTPHSLRRRDRRALAEA